MKRQQDLTDKRDECGCHKGCHTDPHECEVPCQWPNCLTDEEAGDFHEHLRVAYWDDWFGAS